MGEEGQPLDANGRGLELNELADLDLAEATELRPVERLWAAVAIQAIADAIDPACSKNNEAKVFVHGSTFEGIWEWCGLDYRVAPVADVRDKVRYGPTAIRLAMEDFRI